MNFDWTDLKSILVSVAGSILFAVVVYIFYGYWKERTDKQKEQKKLAEEAATKKSQEDFEFEKIRQQLQEAEKLYNNGLFDQSLQRCKTILNTTNVQKHPGLYWSTKMKEGECYFELRIVDKYEENCLHSIDSFLACIETSKLLHDDLAEGLTYLSLGKSLAAMSSIRSKEQNLQKAIDYYKQSLQLFESSDSDVMIREVQRFLAKAYTDFSTIKDKEHYLTIAVKAHRDAISKSHNSSNANDNYIRMNELALTLMKLAEVKDKEANLLEAKTYLKEAADNISIEENAEYLAQTQSNLSCVYGELSEITDKEENLEKALFYTKESLKIYTSKDFPYYHARAMANLGTLLIHWVQFSQNGSKAKETSEAIDMILKAVDFFTLKDYPLNYANTMIALGEAYEIAAIGKDKSLNLQNAIGSYQNALKVFTPVKYPDAHKKCSDSINRLESLMEKTKK